MKSVKVVQPVINLPSIEAELRHLPTEKLKTVFRDSFGKAAEFLARAAICIKIMEERGESLSGVPQIGLFRRIANGRVLPEVAWTFAESPARADVLRIPLAEQKKLAANPVLPVVMVTPDGTTETRMVDLTRAPKDVVQQVVGPAGLRSPKQQAEYLAEKAEESDFIVRSAKVEVEPQTRTVRIRLTFEESQYLTINAARLGMKAHELARSGLIRSGVLANNPKEVPA